MAKHVGDDASIPTSGVVSSQPPPVTTSVPRATHCNKREALRALIQRESARRLAKLGGTEPSLTEIPRRRSEAS